MATYSGEGSFSSRPNFKLQVSVSVSGTTATMTAVAVRTGSETTTPFSNPGTSARRTYSFTNSSSPTSGSAEWVFDFRPAGSSSSSNPYTVGVWSSGVTRTLSASSTVTVTASMSLLGSASVSVNVPIVTTPAPSFIGSFASGTAGSPYSSSITINDANSVTVSAGSLPPGLSGNLSGSTYTLSSSNATTAGTYNFTLSATGDGGTRTQSYSISIAQPAPVISSNMPSTGTVNVLYSGSASATNSPSSWSLGGTLPPGVIGNASGSTYSISGTPTSSGTYNFSLTASNGGGSDTESFSVSIAAPPQPSWTSTAAFASGKVNQGYYQTRTASNTTSITGASTTAPGLIATASGSSTLILQGTPTASGTFGVSATANGTSGTTPASLSTTVTIAPLAPPSWTDTSLSTDFRVGQSYATTSSGNNTLSATNSATFSISGGSLPSGISASRSLSGSTAIYTLTGTPSTRGPFSFIVRASNSDGTASPDLTFSGNVTHPPLWVDQTLAGFSQGRSYSDSLSVSTSTTVTWTVSAGSLPAGIITTTSGTNTNTLSFSGFPIGTGAYSFTITANNGDGTLSKSFSGNILLPPNWVDDQLGSFIEDNLYSDSVVATNSPTYALTGTLPTGISHSNGVVSGTPTTVGQSFNFTITASNADGSVSQTFSGTVQPDLGGGIKVFSGSAWDNKIIHAYDNDAWVEGTLYMFNGSVWAKSVF